MLNRKAFNFTFVFCFALTGIFILTTEQVNATGIKLFLEELEFCGRKLLTRPLHKVSFPHDPFKRFFCSTPKKTSTIENGGKHIHYIRLENRAEGFPEVLFLGGYGTNSINPPDRAESKAILLETICKKIGQTYTRFNYSGYDPNHCWNPNDTPRGTIGGWLSDSLAVIDSVTQKDHPLILIGSSMGGWLMTLAALKRPKRIHALIGIASAPDFIDYCGSWPKEFIEEAQKHRVLQNFINISCPVYLIHGEKDRSVPYQKSVELANRIHEGNSCNLDVNVEIIPGGDHPLKEWLYVEPFLGQTRITSILNKLNKKRK